MPLGCLPGPETALGKQKTRLSVLLSYIFPPFPAFSYHPSYRDRPAQRPGCFNNTSQYHSWPQTSQCRSGPRMCVDVRQVPQLVSPLLGPRDQPAAIHGHREHRVGVAFECSQTFASVQVSQLASTVIGPRERPIPVGGMIKSFRIGVAPQRHCVVSDGQIYCLYIPDITG